MYTWRFLIFPHRFARRYSILRIYTGVHNTKEECESTIIPPLAKNLLHSRLLVQEYYWTYHTTKLNTTATDVSASTIINWRVLSCPPAIKRHEMTTQQAFPRDKSRQQEIQERACLVTVFATNSKLLPGMFYYIAYYSRVESAQKKTGKTNWMHSTWTLRVRGGGGR